MIQSQITLLASAFGLAVALSVAGCGGSGSDPADARATGAQGDAPDGAYEPFKMSNMASQLARVAAYDQIHALRQSEGFGPEHFGQTCAAWSPDIETPSAPDRLASLYIESAGLAKKVAGREDDHSYNAGAAVGAELDSAICAAIEAGAAAADPQAVAVQAQIIDKSLLHFFYLSIFHELNRGSRQTYDEAFGYFGMSLDGTRVGGVAATVAARDQDCGTQYATQIFERLREGHAILEEALVAAQKSGNADALDSLPPALEAVIADIDRGLLEVFGLSFGRELMALQAGDEPAMKLVEARLFWHILRPWVAAQDGVEGSDFATRLDAMLDPDDPSQITPETGFEMLQASFGLDVRAACR